MNVKALLKQLPFSRYSVIAGITGVTLAIGAYQGWAYHQREIGKRELQIVQYEADNRALRMAQDSLAKAYRVDTLRLTKIRLVTDSLTVTVDRWKHDTLRVVEYVTKADSTIRVCVEALQTCEARVGVATRGWDNARNEITKILDRPQPSRTKVWGERAVIGYASVQVGCLIGGQRLCLAFRIP